MQPVIKWGRAWLEDNGFDRRAKDVALTAALAHCDLAGQPLTSCSPAGGALHASWVKAWDSPNQQVATVGGLGLSETLVRRQC